MILVIQVIALVCFLIAWLGIPIPASRPLAWGWFGLFLWLLSLMLGGFALHTAH
jgi:hypothetical protein